MAIESINMRDLVRQHQRDWPDVSFLAQLGANAVLDLLGSGELARFEKGEVLMRENDDENHVFILIDACVKVTAHVRDRETLLAVRLGGDLVGELAGASQSTRLATVQSCTRQPGIAVLVRAPDIARLSALHPAIASALTQTIARKLQAATRRRIDISGSTSRVRLARALVELADDYGQPHRNGHVLIPVSLTHLELGSLVGVSSPTAQRALRALKAEGLIDSGSRPIVLDLARLRSVAGLGLII